MSERIKYMEACDILAKIGTQIMDARRKVMTDDYYYNTSSSLVKRFHDALMSINQLHAEIDLIKMKKK